MIGWLYSEKSLPYVGAASDKVSALEKAGAIVTDSPAKIGASMLKVKFGRSCTHQLYLTNRVGHAGGRTSLIYCHK